MYSPLVHLLSPVVFQGGTTVTITELTSALLLRFYVWKMLHGQLRNFCFPLEGSASPPSPIRTCFPLCCACSKRSRNTSHVRGSVVIAAAS